LDCHGVSCNGGAGGVRSRTSRRSNTTCALIGTSPDASKAFRQIASVNTSKNASLKAGRPSFLVDMENASACQVSNALGVLPFQRREADHVKRLKNMRRVRWHAEGKDLMFNAVVLKLLVEVALITVQDKQSIFPNLAHLCMLVKVLQPLKTKLVVSPAVLRD
jgi:hypothetical protein